MPVLINEHSPLITLYKKWWSPVGPLAGRSWDDDGRDVAVGPGVGADVLAVVDFDI